MHPAGGTGLVPAPIVPEHAVAASGGTIRGTVKAGTVPLPGVAVTATNTLTGKKYATSTDVTGSFAMAIPRNGRYVVRAELAAFASVTQEIVLNAAGENGGKPEEIAEFGMQLASRVAQQDAAAQSAIASVAALRSARGWAAGSQCFERQCGFGGCDCERWWRRCGSSASVAGGGGSERRGYNAGLGSGEWPDGADEWTGEPE